MDIEIQMNGLDDFLSAIYGPGTTLSALLETLGFERAQVERLRAGSLPALADGMIEAVRKRLTWEEKDLYFRLLARRFGLDGEPGSVIEAAAAALGIDPSDAAHAEGEALQRCRYKTALGDFKKELHRLALHELGRAGERPEAGHIVDKLNRLTDLRAAVDLARLDYEARRNEILRTVQAQLDAVDAEYRPLLEAAEANAAALENEIRNDVLLRGESVRNQHFQALYLKGRVSWDNRGLGDYANAHPEVLKFRKEGQPSVSLRLAGGGRSQSESED